MADRIRIYLGGPDVFLPDAVEIGRIKKGICAEHGLVGLFPFDNEVVAVEGGPRIDDLIYAGNVDMMRSADAAIFNLTPFRGPAMDTGTAFEVGFMAALRRPCLGYTNDPRPYRERLGHDGPLTHDPDTGRWLDAAGLMVEDFGNVDNLMVDGSLRACGYDPVRGAVPGQGHPIAGLDAFRACIAIIARELAGS